MPDNQNERLLTHDFPSAFPSDFKPDTSYFYQAVEEHNRERNEVFGLPSLPYEKLSPAEQHDVWGRANEIKLLAQAKVPAKVIPIGPASPSFKVLEPQPAGIGFIAFFLLVTGVLTLICWALKIL